MGDEPSLMDDAFAAVTVPFSLKTGLSVSILSSLTLESSSSSEKYWMFGCFPTGTGSISTANFPLWLASVPRW